jgi:hypothetical protein
MSTLQALWTQCRFIHLIRNGASTALSMSQHPGYAALVDRNEISWVALSHRWQPAGWTAIKRDISAFVRLWRLRVSRTREEAGRLKDGTYLELRYEDLVAAPRACLSAICSHVELPAADSWLHAAADLVDPGKRKASPMPEIRSVLSDEDAELLRELRYL